MFVCTSYVYMCAIFAWGNVLTFGTIHDLQSTLKGFLTPTQVGGWVSWVRDCTPLRVKCEVWVCQMCTFLSQIERGTISDPGDLFQPTPFSHKFTNFQSTCKSVDIFPTSTYLYANVCSLWTYHCWMELRCKKAKQLRDFNAYLRQQIGIYEVLFARYLLFVQRVCTTIV